MNGRARAGRRAAVVAIVWVAGCHTGGSDWVNEPATEDDAQIRAQDLRPPEERRGHGVTAGQFRTQSIGAEGPNEGLTPGLPGTAAPPGQGRSLGVFRNTYYDFPSEGDFQGALTPLFDGHCKKIKDVPRGFHDAVCVQGSGLLASGSTVSFAKRDCECAEVCPRTNQRICFDKLDQALFPWGRGATGQPITPLVTVAVDDAIVPIGTAIYIPEFVGLPRDAARSSLHDGCFIAQDRGSSVSGQHIDVFTGHAAITRLWNTLVPSNKGVTVIVDSPRCAR